MNDDQPSFWQIRWMEENDKRFSEQDRRYAEGDALRKEALQILQTATETALGLQRDAQEYRDEQANKLREQINSERNLYATKNDLAALEDKVVAQIKPITDALQQNVGSTITKSTLIGYLLAACTVIGFIVAVANGKI